MNGPVFMPYPQDTAFPVVHTIHGPFQAADALMVIGALPPDGYVRLPNIGSIRVDVLLCLCALKTFGVLL